MVKYPNISVDLTTDEGNAFNIMLRVSTALRANEVDDEQIEKYLEQSCAKDYNHLLKTAGEWVNVV